MRRFLLSIAAWLILLMAPAQEDQALLWKVEHPKKKGTSYLMGTIHVADPRVSEALVPLIPLIAQCDLLAGEVDMRDMDNAQRSLLRLMFLENTKLRNLFSELDYAEVKAYLDEEYGIVAPFMENFKPIFVAMMPPLDFADSSSGPVMDDQLQQLALNMGKRVSGLEVAETTLKRLGEISLQEQSSYLLHMVRSAGTDSLFTANMMNMYFEGRVADLAALSSEFEGFPTLEKMLLDDRNFLFVKNMCKMMKKNNVFCAVGALHLPGQSGMVQLLRDAGYTVIPFSPKKLL